jgi:hypothetical protein
MHDVIRGFFAASLMRGRAAGGINPEGFRTCMIAVGREPVGINSTSTSRIAKR